MILATAVFSSIYSVIGIVMGLLGLVGMAATGWVVTRSSMVKNTIATQDNYIKALKQENDYQLGHVEKLEARITTLESQLDLMQEMVTSKAAVESLAKTVNEQHEEIMKELSR